MPLIWFEIRGDLSTNVAWWVNVALQMPVIGTASFFSLLVICLIVVGISVTIMLRRRSRTHIMAPITDKVDDRAWISATISIPMGNRSRMFNYCLVWMMISSIPLILLSSSHMMSISVRLFWIAINYFFMWISGVKVTVSCPLKYLFDFIVDAHTWIYPMLFVNHCWRMCRLMFVSQGNFIVPFWFKGLL